jgi:hypothetical protein
LLTSIRSASRRSSAPAKRRISRFHCRGTGAPSQAASHLTPAAAAGDDVGDQALRATRGTSLFCAMKSEKCAFKTSSAPPTLLAQGMMSLSCQRRDSGA